MKGKYVCRWIFQHLYKRRGLLGVVVRTGEGLQQCTVLIGVHLCRWEKFLNAEELKVHARHSNDVLFCQIKAGRMAGEERGVYPWASLQGITLWVPERERRMSEGCILSPINLSSSACIYFAVFSYTCLRKLFSLQPLCFSNYAFLSMNARDCCGSSGEGTTRPLSSQSLFCL